jgi:hypothetical protein
MKIKGVDTKAQLSKAEEIKVLEALKVAFYGTGNYLEKLFSPEFVAWASKEIQNDWFPDAWGYMEHLQAQIGRLTLAANESKVPELEAQVGRLRESLEERAGVVRSLQEALAKRNDEFLQLKGSHIKAETALVSLRVALDRLKDY